MAEEKKLTLEEAKVLLAEKDELIKELMDQVEELEKKPSAKKFLTFTHDKVKYEVRNDGWYEPSLGKTVTAGEAVKDKDLCKSLVERGVGFIVPWKKKS